MTDQTKTCPACETELPIEQFRLLAQNKRHPTWTPSRFYRCRDCERESNRLRLSKQYHDDAVYREKQIANASVQRERQAARRRGTE